jgi:hypothetical protein
MRNQDLVAGLACRNLYTVECYDRDGNLKWSEDIKNITVNAGLNEILDKFWKGSSYTAAHYVGLIDNAGFSAIAAADTMASHAGWTESTVYSEGARPALILGSVASQSVNNTASKAVFTVTGSATINGAFVATNSTKGGTTGVLIGGASFGSARSVQSGDTLNVSVTLTVASA